MHPPNRWANTRLSLIFEDVRSRLRQMSSVPQRVFEFALREDVLLVILLVLGIHLLLALASDFTQDSWLLLLGGRVVDHGLPHYNDLTLWGRGRPWIDQQWLGQLGFYWLYLAGGLQAVALGGALIYLAVVAAAAASARYLGGSVVAVAICLVVAFPTLFYFAGVRTQLLGFGFFVAVLFLLLSDLHKQTAWRTLSVLPVLILWANVHGSVIVGAATASAYGLFQLLGGARGHARARAVILLCVSPACVLASPYGLSLIGYYKHVLNNPELARFVSEWGPTPLGVYAIGFFALLMMVLVAGVYAIIKSRRGSKGISVFECALLLALAIAGIMALRDTIFFVFAALIILPPRLTALLTKLHSSRTLPSVRPPHQHVARAVLAVVTALATLALVFSIFSAPLKISTSYARLAAATALSARTHPHAPVDASWLYADYLLWKDPVLAGRVLYDIRYELLSAAQIQSVHTQTTTAAWARTVRPGVIVVAPADSPAIKLLTNPFYYDITYESKIGVIAVRR